MIMTSLDLQLISILNKIDHFKESFETTGLSSLNFLSFDSLAYS